jgi:hypothetical protein
MLDPTLVPPINPGEYPDYWVFEIKKIVPDGEDRRNQKAKIVVIHEYDNIYDMVAWFSKEALAYENIQDKVEICNDIMREITLCTLCHVPEEKCTCSFYSYDEQSDMEIPELFNQTRYESLLPTSDEYLHLLETDVDNSINTIGLMYTIYTTLVLWFWQFYMREPIIKWIVSCFSGLNVCKRVVFQLPTQISEIRTLFVTIGDRVKRRLDLADVVISAAATLTSLFALYKTYKYMFPTKLTQQSSEQSCPVVDDAEARPNVWFKDDYRTTDFDVSRKSRSMNGLDTPTLSNIILKNCACFRIFSGEVTQNTRATCLGGHLYLLNNHAVPLDTTHIEIIVSPLDTGVNRNIRIIFTESMIIRDPLKDIAILNISILPPRKNIIDLFPTDNTFRFKGDGFYISRNKLGYKEITNVYNVQNSMYFQDDVTDPYKWSGNVDEDTPQGSCGSLLVTKGPSGFQILGIHLYGGMLNKIYSISLSQKYLNDLIANHNKFIVQSSSPMLDTVEYPREVTDLHMKSPIRFISEGTANVYGSFKGFRPNHKSGVQNTFIHDEVKKYGYEVKYTAPMMHGWTPWRIALLDMVRPVTEIKMDVVDKVKKSFINDILSSLDKTQVSNMIVLDTFTAINGAAGVTFIDRINTSTSAGNPYKKSKKHFLFPTEPLNGLNEAVTFDDTIMNRIDEMETRYKNGERVYPNFCAHLKDEPVTFQKAKIGKTRVFTGAPIDWSIVVRKYTLSFTKLLQSNRFVFEAAPGTICQSPEWNEIRKFLVEFGEDRIVAGDYAKFDKRMPASLILAAFDIIIAVSRQAGFDDDDILVLKGIAEDTAFPLVDFNGDLIEFYGSNPSGHPLTVIINSLVNSLYMRYVYYELNPEKEAESFQDNVHLMTYGDDNIMGVSHKSPWFNHTAIQKVLADIDIQYTMADKEAESVPYIHINDSSFLKRKWRYEENLNMYVCPLDPDSIEKMLLTCVKSKTVSLKHQAIEVMGTALREYFWYGEEMYRAKEVMFKEIVSNTGLQSYVEDSTFPSYESLIEKFQDMKKCFRRSF